MRRTQSLAGACGALVLLMPCAVQADCKVYSPYVEKGELEVEARGCLLTDSSPQQDGAHTEHYEVGYGLTDWWSSTLALEYAKDPGGEYQATTRGWENIFQLTEPGRYWLDAGLYLEYEWAATRAETNSGEAKLLLAKDVGRWTNTANLILERGFGADANRVEVSYAWQTRYRWRPELEPAIEAYGGLSAGNNEELGGSSQAIGPALLGRFRLTSGLSLGYEAGYLFGLNHSSPSGTVKWSLELEAHL